MKQISWTGLYNESWQGEITPEAFSHPAKFSRGLIRQIYKFMLDEGMLAAGSHVVDPFGGVGLGALDAMRHGLHWHGCELEPRFHELGNQNIGLWNGRYRGWFADWGTAVLHCGDSRQLAQVIGAADGCVSSPPYADAIDTKSHGIRDERRAKNAEDIQPAHYGSHPGQLGSMKAGDYDAAVSSPPFSPPGNQPPAMRAHAPVRSKWVDEPDRPDNYGETAGQLGAMPMNDYDAAISSPPYADTIENGDGPGARWDAAGHPGNPDKVSSQAAYGTSAGQLGQMDGAVSSPPFEASLAGGVSNNGLQPRPGDVRKYERTMTIDDSYGTETGNIGNDTGESFWLAARDIVAQVYNVLKPGGVAAWVCGDFVRRGERVYFGRQWLALCESVGFEPVAWAVAWKTEYNGNQLDIFGGEVEKRTDRVSFFRRLANEKNPDAAILNEDVIFVRKPL